ncbi:MAG: hypothetical protein ABSE63_18120 [Thermoguttaceae bacterium]|jgi:hypothetical protein
MVNRKTKMVWQILVASVIVCAFSSCGSQRPEVQFVRQKIPISIQSDKPITVEISLSGNGDNQVGIRCSPQVWNALPKGEDAIVVNLKSSNKPNTEIGGISPGSGKRWPIESFHYLFYIFGEYNAKATVEITFPHAPPGTTHAEIIVCKTPADTGL